LLFDVRHALPHAEVRFDVRMLRLTPNFFGGGNLAFIHFGVVSLPDYFYEYKATKKTIKPNFLPPSFVVRCALRNLVSRDYMTSVSLS